jgi:hypothetical protein
MHTLTSPPWVSGRLGNPGLIWERCAVLLWPSNFWTTASPSATCSRRYPGLDPFFFKVPRAAAFSQNLICACQASLRCCSLMDAGSHSATGIRVRAAGVLRDERAPASCSVGAVGVASPADAIWTGHNSPSAVPRRRAARCACQPPPAPPASKQVASKKSSTGSQEKCRCFQEMSVFPGSCDLLKILC